MTAYDPNDTTVTYSSFNSSGIIWLVDGDGNFQSNLTGLSLVLQTVHGTTARLLLDTSGAACVSTEDLTVATVTDRR